jgi:hypothetical protein
VPFSEKLLLSLLKGEEMRFFLFLSLLLFFSDAKNDKPAENNETKKQKVKK